MLMQFKFNITHNFTLNQGQSVDYNRFVASTSPVMERLDAWMVSWRSEVNQALQRIKHQVI